MPSGHLSWVPGPVLSAWIDAAVEEVAAACNVNKYAVLGRSRHGRVASARRILAALLREHLNLSLPEMAYMFGTTHQSVLYAVRRAHARTEELVVVNAVAKRLPPPDEARQEVALLRYRRAMEAWRRRRDGSPPPQPADCAWECRCEPCRIENLRRLRHGDGFFCVECNKEYIAKP